MRLLVTILIALGSVAPAGAQSTQVDPWPREAEQPSAPKPAAATRAALDTIGEYARVPGSRGAGEHLLIFERDGQLWTILDRGDARPFAEISKDLGATFRRMQVGPGAGGQLKVTPLRAVADVLRESLAAAPPNETGDLKAADLVELTKLDPTIRLDIRYATTNNFLGSVFYAQARAFLQRPAAEAVVRAVRALKPLGYGLLVHDGYRPWYVTKTFWDATPDDRKWMVANPARGSNHNRGAAVDLTLYDLKTGAVTEMPSTYDESTTRAYAFYPGGTSLQRWHRALLRRAMEAEGFTVNPTEWWHFDYKDFRSYRIGNVRFDQIR